MLYKNIHKKALACFFVLFFLFLVFNDYAIGEVYLPGFGYVDTQPPSSSALPNPKDTKSWVNATLEYPANKGWEGNPHKLVVQQGDSKAILNWYTFDIGKDAEVFFDQKGNSDWVALNHIGDNSPSKIYGKLAADGKIFLINQNGIIFGPTARIDVNTLLASTLKVTDEDFLNGEALLFSDDSGVAGDNAPAVVNYSGEIKTKKGGAVFLFAPKVANNGIILSEGGQIVLAAGKTVYLSSRSDGRGMFVEVTAPEGCNALNLNTLIADTGLIGMYGWAVNQEGLIRAITAIKRNGIIELHASHQVSTGEKSFISSSISPSAEKVHESFEFEGGVVDIRGLKGMDKNGLIVEDPLEHIQHRGVIQATAGIVNMEAQERVFLEDESGIEVNGSWIEMPGEEKLLEVQLNSVQLRDDFGQKDGILKGETITLNSLDGTSIGNISDSLNSEEKDVGERSINGGQVTISTKSESGDIIVKEGARIDFSGGGIRYGDSFLDTTKVSTGNRIYDISDASQWIKYEKIVTQQSKENKRFGITDAFSGLYFGGPYPIMDYYSGYVEGGDGGTLQLVGKSIILDGFIDGSVTSGYFQDKENDVEDQNGYQKTKGRRDPTGGTVILGEASGGLYETRDHELGDIVIASDVESLPSSFSPSDELPAFYEGTAGNGRRIVLSSEKLNVSGIENLELYSNSKITIEEGADLWVRDGGNVSIVARNIEHQGKITAPSGAIRLDIEDNITSSEIKMDQRIYLAEGSVVSAAGLRVDNSRVSENEIQNIVDVKVQGGAVEIKDKTDLGEGVIIMPGALVDVSGGYVIDEDGTVHGGDAGDLEIQGSAIALEGDIVGHSLEGKDGGTISLHADTLLVSRDVTKLPEGFTATSPMPEWIKGQLHFSDKWTGPTGFTRLTLKSANDIIFSEGSIIKPSQTKLAPPLAGGRRSEEVLPDSYSLFEISNNSENDNFIHLPFENNGFTSINLQAGSIFEGKEAGSAEMVSKIDIPINAGIVVSPGGEVKLDAPDIEIGGLIEAHGGVLSITAKGGSVDVGGVQKEMGLKVKEGSQIIASGCTIMQDTSIINGLPLKYSSFSGGRITLQASQGDLIIEEGAVVDVSGAPFRDTFMSPPMLQEDDYSISFPLFVSNPGRLSLLYYDDLDVAGELRSENYSPLKNVMGGGLTISKMNNLEDMVVSDELIELYNNSTFDALNLSSYKGIALSGNWETKSGREVFLNTPEVTSDGKVVSFNAAHIKLGNSSAFLSANDPKPGDGKIMFSADWIDVEGSVNLAGVNDVLLFAHKDISFSDHLYSAAGIDRWEGSLDIPGSLILKASCIYPTTYTDFRIGADSVSIYPSEIPADGRVYSAGGSLGINAGKIENYGTIFAPLGNVSLVAQERVYIGEGSIIDTSADQTIVYGTLNDFFWTIPDKTLEQIAQKDVEGEPEKIITIEGKEVIIREGAQLNISSGGGIFAYQFQAGVEGSENPIKGRGYQVIVPDGGFDLPGEAVYLEGEYGLREGIYSLLSEDYAFVPGAMLLIDLGEDDSVGADVLSKEGYSIIRGYGGIMGTDIINGQWHNYAIRPADVVITEGHLNKRDIASKMVGNIEIKGETTILDGEIIADTGVSGTLISDENTDDYKGGTISLNARNIIIQSTVTDLPYGFGSESEVPEELKDKLLLSSEGLSNKGLREINIGGELQKTEVESIVFREGSNLECSYINLSARRHITIESNTRIDSSGEVGGSVRLSALALGGNAGDPVGIIIKEGASIHAADTITLDSPMIDQRGALSSEGSSLILASDSIHVIKDDYTGDRSDGLYVFESMKGFNGFENVGLKAASNITFNEDIELRVENELLLDSPLIAGIAMQDTDAVKLSARWINIKNSHGEIYETKSESRAGVLSMSAEDIFIGSGDVAVEGFEKIALMSTKDITFTGEGSLRASGDIDMSGRMITTSSGEVEMGLTNTDFRIETSTGDIFINSIGAVPDKRPSSGGSLQIKGNHIEHSGLIDIPSGRIIFVGSADVTMMPGSIINTRGLESSIVEHGGQISVRAEGDGQVYIQEGALLDASGVNDGEGGSITLLSSRGGVILEGEVQANAGKAGVAGGNIVLSTDEILGENGFSELNDTLDIGGFTAGIKIETRAGSITIGEGEKINTHDFTLVANGGAIDVYGEINTSNDQDGGRVGLYASGDLSMHDGSRINANGISSDSSGGEVTLSSVNGYINLNEGSTLNVQAGDNAKRGNVTLHAIRYDTNGDGVVNDVKANIKNIINGASTLIVEACQVYESDIPLKELTKTDIEAIRGDTDSFMAHKAGITNTLFGSLVNNGSSIDTTLFIPGVEIKNSGDIILSGVKDFHTDWDLTHWRYDHIPGVMTIKAGGTVNVNTFLVDHPTDKFDLLNPDADVEKGLDSWGFNLVAGAALDSAYPLATRQGCEADLIIGDGMLVYSESAPINFASARDTFVGKAHDPGMRGEYDFVHHKDLQYNLATFDAPVYGLVGRDIKVKGGAIQSTTGNISLITGNDILLEKVDNVYGTLRTLGRPSSNKNDFWSYFDGGDIELIAGGKVKGGLSDNAWDEIYKIRIPESIPPEWVYEWGPNYARNNATQGIVTMAGGNIAVSSFGSFYGQIGTFGEGDLDIHSGGDIDGRFLIKEGSGKIRGMASFGTGNADTTIEIFDTMADIRVIGHIQLGSIVNPTLARPANYSGHQTMTYSPDTKITLQAVKGDISIAGLSHYNISKTEYDRILPSKMELMAGGDIVWTNNFALAPASDSGLSLIAGADIKGPGTILVSDLDPSIVYGVKLTLSSEPSLLDFFSRYAHSASPMHIGDNEPVEIKAGGYLKDLNIFIPKKADIFAAKDIININFMGQNSNMGGDITSIRTDGDILFSSATKYFNTGIIHGGPGFLLVQAGGSIDLGMSKGIQSVGNFYNPALGSKGSDVAVIAGSARDFLSEDMKNSKGGYDLLAGRINNFFEDLRIAGEDFNDLKNKGEADVAKERIDVLRQEVIRPFFSDDTGDGGSINMVSSTINTTCGDDDIFIITQGEIDVGESTIARNEDATDKGDKSTGIFTAGGGAINVYADGDINVNASRVMTFRGVDAERGADIILYSDQGNVNAGRGSKSAINANPPQKTKIGDVWVVQFSPPAVGSGIRTLTYDPDGEDGPIKEPAMGDIYLFAPRGLIDAGEAGVAGRRIVLGATKIANVQNINSDKGTMGLPPVANLSGSIGTLSGSSSSLSEVEKLTEQTKVMSTEEKEILNKTIKDLVQNLSLNQVDVEVIGFEEDKKKKEEDAKEREEGDIQEKK